MQYTGAGVTGVSLASRAYGWFTHLKALNRIMHIPNRNGAHWQASSVYDLVMSLEPTKDPADRSKEEELQSRPAWRRTDHRAKENDVLQHVADE